PTHHTVLCKFKKDAPEDLMQAFIEDARAVRFSSPDVLSLALGPPIDTTRAKGYDIGVVLVLSSIEAMKPFAESPSQLRLRARREAICEDTLAYDIEV
ncbi:hypothetical protein L207DRAFT_413873, partial [Hyaloscypha variabilis F]